MAKKNLSATITIGGAVSGTLGAAVKSTNSQLGEIGKAISGNMLKPYQQVNKEIDKQKQKLGELHAAKDKGASMMGAGAVGLGIAGAVIGAAAFPVKAAVDFENAMLGVAKQVTGARDSSGHLTAVYRDMGKELQILGRTVPMSTNKLAEMAAAGARMDVPREQLIEFTKTAAMMAEAFELPAGELADQMGKIKKLFGLQTQAEVRSLADAVNYLDDNAISKGGDIIDFLTRTGGLAGSVKVTGSQMAALGSTLLTLGERTESAGTAVNAIFAKLAAAESGTKKFRGAMAQLGLSLTEVQKGMQIDAQGTLLKVLDKVQQLPKDQQMGVLTQLVGLEHADTLTKLANGVGEYRAQIAMANSEAAKGSMAREFSARLQTTSAQWEILKNKTTEFSVNIGATLLPALNELVGKIGNVVTSLTDWSAKNPEAASTLISVGEAVGIAATAFGVLTTGIGAAKFAFNALKIAAISNPLGAAFAAVATAGILIYQNWEPIKLFFQGLWITIGEGIDDVLKKIAGIGDAWRAFKQSFGMGGGSAAPGTAPAAQDLPLPAPPPKWQAAMKGPTTQYNTFNVQQQPGQDGQALARELVNEMAKRDAARRRGSTHDRVGAY